eukprot:945704_1
MSDLLDAINIASNGDTILIHHGDVMDSLSIDKCLHIIGIGDNVLIQCDEWIGVDNHVYFKDIKFKINCIHNDPGIYVSPGCALFMEHCIVDFALEGIYTGENCIVNLNNCKLNGGDDSIGAIAIREKVKSMSITQCIFRGCGRSDCISADTNENVIGARLTLIDNLFVNNSGKPIGCWGRSVPRIYHTNVVFEENRIQRN